MLSSQVASMTVDELKAVIAEVIDDRFGKLLNILSITSLPAIPSSIATDQQVLPVAEEHPWLKIAGIYKDNLLFDEVIAEIELRRHEVNASELCNIDLESDTKDRVA